jgi:hypothetical protein
MEQTPAYPEADYSGPLSRKLTGVYIFKRYTSVEPLFRKEETQKEWSFISRFNTLLEIREGYL